MMIIMIACRMSSTWNVVNLIGGADRLAWRVVCMWVYIHSPTTQLNCPHFGESSIVMSRLRFAFTMRTIVNISYKMIEIRLFYLIRPRQLSASGHEAFDMDCF